MIATGHYARVKDGQLLAGVDKNKDQSYFLCRVTEEALKHTLMPIGEYEKPAVRGLARKFGLYTAEKKDSQGICFVGKVGIKDFLKEFVHDLPGDGDIIDQTGKAIGRHDGALFYTIGQRQGLGVGGGLPYYVVGKDMAKNEVYVTADLQDERLWSDSITITTPHWINQPPQENHENGAYTVRTRYRAELIPVTGLKQLPDGNWQVQLKDEVRAVTAGQSAVVYNGERVVGSGIVI
jgi:tRNA-specific 2-thiouridylase